MFTRKNNGLISKALSIALALLLVLPTAVFADEGGPSTEPAPVAETAPADEGAAQADPVVGEAPEGAPVDDGMPKEEAQDLEPKSAEASVLPDPQVTIIEEVDFSEIVEALEEANFVIVDETGAELPLASQEAAEILLAPDPFIERAGVTYRFMTDCSGYPDNPTSICTVSVAPIQAALSFSVDGEEIKIDQGHYQEDVVVNKNVVFTGLGAGATANSITLNSLIGGASSGFSAALVVVNPGAKIADGIELVEEGGTVEVNPGTYAEQLDINKSMSLKGAGAADTYIVPDPAYVHCWGPSCGPGDRALLEINGGDEGASGHTIEVLVDGFTLDGQYMYGNKFGVLVHGGAFAEVSHNIVKNFYDHAYPGGNQVNMLVGYLGQDWPWSGSAGWWDYTGHAYMHDNLVTGFNTVGMMIWGPNSTGTFDNNIINPDPNDTHLSAGAMGIVLQRSGTALITNNTIQNLVTIGAGTPGYYRSGMEAYWPGPTTITGNTFNGNDYGFAMYNNYSQSSAFDTVMDGNTFSNNGVGVQLGGINLQSFTGNRFLNNSTVGVTNTMNVLVDARGNWWGTPDGPSALNGVQYLNNGGLGAPTGTGDSLSDYLLYDPYLTSDPAILPPDDDGDDDEVFPVLTPVDATLGLIPVTGGQLVQLPCQTQCVTVLLADGSWAEFCGLCGYWVSLSEEDKDTLPYALPAESEMVNGMTVQLLDADQNVLDAIPAGATMQVGFPVSAEAEPASLRMHEYDLVKKDWQTLAVTIGGDWAQAYTTFPGTVILVR